MNVCDWRSRPRASTCRSPESLRQFIRPAPASPQHPNRVSKFDWKRDLAPCCSALVADKAYDSDAIPDDLKQRSIRAVIPPKSNRTNTICYSKRLYRQRNCIERVLGHLKINRAIATRYDQLAESFLGMLFIASARYWIKFVHAA